jgi:hypothetical protein
VLKNVARAMWEASPTPVKGIHLKAKSASERPPTICLLSGRTSIFVTTITTIMGDRVARDVAFFGQARKRTIIIDPFGTDRGLATVGWCVLEVWLAWLRSFCTPLWVS